MKLENNIIIGTEVNTDGVEQGVVDIERITDNLKDIKIEVDDNDIVQGLADNLDEILKEYKELTTGPVLFGSDLQQAENLKLQVKEIVNKIEELTGEKLIIKGFTDVDNTLPSINTKISNMGKSLERVAKKVSRIGFSLIGIHSLYGMISSSMSRIMAQQPELKAEIDAIKNALDNLVAKLLNLLMPIIEAIVALLGIILQDIFGIDLSANNFSKSMKKANKSAGQLRKQLLGFDEMNILNKDGTTGLGVTAPSNLSLQDITDKIQKWFDEHKIKISLEYFRDFLKNPIEYLEVGMDELNEPAYELLDKYFGSGSAGSILEPTSGKGLYEKYGDIWEEAKKFLNNQATFEGDMVTLTDEFGREIKLTLPYYRSLVELYSSNYWSAKMGGPIRDFIKQYKKLPPVEKDIKAINQGLKAFATETKEGWYNVFSKMKSYINGATYEYKNGLYEVRMANGETRTYTEQQFSYLQQFAKENNLKLVKDNTDLNNKIQNNTNATKDVVIAGINAIKTKANETNNEIEQGASGTAKGVSSSWNAVSGAVTTGLAGIEDSSRTSSKQSADNVKNEYKTLPSWMEDNVFVKLLKEFGVLGSDTGQTFGKGLKDAVNKVIDKIETSINSVFTTATNMFKKFGISVPVPKVKFPRLAKGGIINQPGRGVNYGTANIGERGREAILPLTDSQQMALLGREIAKNIVINLTNITELDGRQIAIATTKAMNEMNFASNGGVI